MFTRYYRFVMVLLAATLVAACGGHRHSAPLVFSTTLSGAEQTPPNNSTAWGTGILTVDLERGTLIASIVIAGVEDVAAHIHHAFPGLNGPIVLPLAKVGGEMVWAGSARISDAELDALRAGRLYLDVHSTRLPEGEIRGQLYEVFPPDEHIRRLYQVAHLSPLLDEQLFLLEEADEWHYGDYTGFGIGLSFGF